MADNISEVLGLSAPVDASQASADPNSFQGSPTPTEAQSPNDTPLVLHDDERDKVITLPSFDIPKFQKELKSDPGVLDLFTRGMGNRLQEYAKGTSIDTAYLTFDLMGDKDGARAQRNFRLALQTKMAQDSALPDKPSIGQEVISGLGGMAGDTYVLAGAAALGVLAAVAAPVEVSLAAAGMAAAGITFGYKAITQKIAELRTKDVPKMPAYLLGGAEGALNTALLNYGYGTMANAFSIKLAPKVEALIAKLPSLARGATVVATKGVVSATGPTAAMVASGRVDTAVNVATGTEQFDLKSELHKLSVEFATGMVGGTALGAAHALAARRQMVTHLTNEGIPKVEAAKVVDQHLMDTAKLSLKAAQEVTGVSDDHIAQIGRAFDDKLDKKMEIAKEVQDWAAKVEVGSKQYDEVRVDAEGNVIPKTEGESAVTTPVDPNAPPTKVIRADQLRSEALQTLSGKVQTYDKSRVYTVKEIKDVRRNLNNLISATKLTPESQNKLRKMSESILTDKDFHSKFPAFREAVNKLVVAERVNLYRGYADNLLSKLQGKEVSPDTRTFAEHLQGVLDGKIKELKFSGDELGKGILEGTLHDLREYDFNEYNGQVAIEALKDLYKKGTEIYSSARKERQAEFDSKISEAVSVLSKIKQGREIRSAHQRQSEVPEIIQQDRARGQGVPLEWWSPDYLIRERMDRGAGLPVREGFFVKELSEHEAALAFQTRQGNFNHEYNGKYKEFYSTARDTLMHEHRVGEVARIQYVQSEGKARPEIPITKSQAFDLWLTAQEADGRNALLKDNHIDPVWLEKFENGEIVKFSEADRKLLNYAREVLDSLAPEIKTTIETLTDKPFRLIDNYWMRERVFAEADVETSRSIAKLAFGDGAKPFNRLETHHNLLERTGGNSPVKIKDFYSSFSNYVRDMNYFLSYAKMLEKRRILLSDPAVRDGIRAKMGEGYLQALDKYTDLYSNMGMLRQGTNAASNALYRFTGRVIKSVLATPTSCLRQASGIVMGLEYVSPKELLQSFSEMPAAYKSGEAREFFDAGALKYRWDSGMYDQAVAISNEYLRKNGKPRFYDTKAFNDAMEFFVKSGDQFASMRVGYAVYKKTLAETGSKASAVSKAMDAIGSTQQSLGIETTPLIFFDKNYISRMAVVFAKTPSQYLSKFYLPELTAAKDKFFSDVIEMRKGKARAYEASRVSLKQLATTIAKWSVVYPLIDYLITFRDIPRDAEDALWMMAAPARYSSLVWDAMTGVTGIIASAMGAEINDKLTPDDQGGFVGRYINSCQYAFKAMVEAIENPDWFTSTPEETAQNIGNVAKEVVPPIASAAGLPGEKAVNALTGFYYLSNFFSSGDGYDLEMGLRGTLLQQTESGAQKAIQRGSE